jgi:thiamine-phosphate pyrophosphorylase
LLQKIKLYSITSYRTDLSIEDQVEQACQGGTDAVQLRDKTSSAKKIIDIAKRAAEICKKFNVLFFLNDRPDLAMHVGADGVHLGQDDAPIELAKQILGPRKIVGCSVHSLGQAINAQAEGADYIAVGPIYATPNKTGKEPSGVDIIRMIKKRVKVPLIAIGGIGLDNINEVFAAGADGIACIGAVCGAKDIRLSTKNIKDRIIAVEKELKNVKDTLLS